MFYLKNDDMEELFRKAAENYEVDTQKASDWDSVHTALHGKDNSSNNGGNEGKKKKKRRFIFWWFLLFPAGWMAHNTWNRNFNNQKLNPATQAAYQQSGTALQHIAPGQDIAIAGTNKEKTIEINKSSLTKQAANSSLISSLPDSKKLKLVRAVTDPRNKQPVKINGSNDPASKKISGAAVPIATEIKLQIEYQDRLENLQDKAGDVLMGLSDTPALTLQKVGITRMILPKLMVEQYITDKSGIKDNNNKIEKDSASPVKAKAIQANTKHRYFYLQALIAPDISTVKFQKVAGLGYSAGLLFGYRINKRWQVEAGALWEKKQYYTNGEYFDKSKLPYFNNNNIHIYSVNGNCRMVTIPVNVRYNIKTDKKNNWFVTSGISSYLMNKEYYDYTYDNYGSVHTKGWSYKKKSQVLMAAINLSAGYERQVGKLYQLRVEPYFRIPVSGVGKGSLLLNSSGIYIGIGKILR